MIFHKWISTDSEEHISCLICGGMWTLAGNGKASGEYAQSFTGDFAVDCTGNTSQCHHYPDECPADECMINPDCNCLHCYS